jgi:class 3 adenylate cyclase
MELTRSRPWPRAALLLFFFVTPLFGLFFDQAFRIHLAIREEQRRFRQTMRERLNDVQLSCSEKYQLSQRIADFHRNCSELLDINHERFDPARVLNQSSALKATLPQHDLLVATELPAWIPALIGMILADAGSEPILWDFTGEGFQHPQTPYYWPWFSFQRWHHPALCVVLFSQDWDRLRRKHLSEILEIMGTDRTHAYFKKRPQILHEILQFPLPTWELNTLQNHIRYKSEGMMSAFLSRGGNTGLIWLYPDQSDRRLLLFSVMNFQDNERRFSLTQILKSEPLGRFGMVFLPSGEAPLLFSDYFRHYPRLKARLESSRDRLANGTWEGEIDGQYVCVAPGHLEKPLQVVVAGRFPSLHAQTWPQELFMLFLAGIMILGSIFIVRRSLWRVGPRWGIGILLLCVFFTASGIPGSLARFLLRNTLEELKEGDRREAEEALWERFHVLDRRFLLLEADLRQRITLTSRSGKLAEWLETEARNPGKGFPPLLASFNPEYPVSAPHEMLLAVISGSGTSGLSYVRSDSSPDLSLITDLFRPFLQKYLSRANPAAMASTPDSPPSDRLQLDDVTREFQNDFLVDFFNGIYGPHQFQKLNADFFSQLGGGNMLTRINILIHPLLPKKLLSHLGFFLWSNYELEDKFLNRFVKNREFLPPEVRILAVRKLEHQQFFKESEVHSPPIMWQLIDRVRRTRVPQLSRKWEEERGFLLAGMPSRSLENYFVSCLFSLDRYIERQQKAGRIFDLVVVLSTFLPLFFGLLIRMHFMAPLRRLESGIQAIARQDFSPRLDAQREDEFGSLAATFNLMATGLQEGTLLGRYVSSAVLQVVRDKDSYTRAMQGETREVTVVFSSFCGFEEYRQTHSPGEVFTLLTAHLEAADRGVKAHGGIIDKVIGDKIMLFFDHAALGGGAAAMTATISVVGEIRRALAAAALPTAIGINTGFVIAGILGARQVHLDYTVIGDAVNVAARLNAIAYKNPRGGVVLSQPTRNLLPKIVPVVSEGVVQVKGKSEGLAIFRLS